MAFEIEMANDVTGAMEKMRGSNNRANTSSRSDGRAYYNSRDTQECYSVAWEHASTATDEWVGYWKNTSTTDDLVIIGIGVNSIPTATVQLYFVTGTPSGGTALNPTNLNGGSANAHDGDGYEGGAAAAGIGGLSAGALIDILHCPANGHEEFRLRDTLRLAQNQAVAIRFHVTAGGNTAGVIFGYYEKTA